MYKNNNFMVILSNNEIIKMTNLIHVTHLHTHTYI